VELKKVSCVHVQFCACVCEFSGLCKCKLYTINELFQLDWVYSRNHQSPLRLWPARLFAHSSCDSGDSHTRAGGHSFLICGALFLPFASILPSCFYSSYRSSCSVHWLLRIYSFESDILLQLWSDCSRYRRDSAGHCGNTLVSSPSPSAPIWLFERSR
jgi:hypothetical protein